MQSNIWYLTDEALKHFITNAIAEDIGSGDHSSLGAIPKHTVSKAVLRLKDDGILAGVEMAKLILNTIDPELELQIFKHDGEQVKFGDIAFEVRGSAQSILMAERLLLNCMQRMSGIATYTRQLATMIQHTGARLLDTRKTTPNFRMAEKWAVLIGGGTNHRFGLYDMIMLKDNHIDYAGGITAAFEHVQAYLKTKQLHLDIVIETRNMKEVEEVLSLRGVRRILLDNMSPDQLREAIRLINGRVETEASGGINVNTIVAVAETGVNYISVGALTHTVRSLDMSLKADLISRG
jgi:nicotinate-nucleotide pyrophosphorylase (carboxylating)